MKIFPADSKPASRASTKPTSKSENPSTEGKISRKKVSGPPRKEISESEIKKKLEAHSSNSDAAKDVVISKNAKRLGEGFLNPDAKPIVVDEVRVEAPVKTIGEPAVAAPEEVKAAPAKVLDRKSDIDLNDPKDSNTQEKLKTVLTKGAFNFNAKEREALEKILGS